MTNNYLNMLSNLYISFINEVFGQNYSQTIKKTRLLPRLFPKLFPDCCFLQTQSLAPPIQESFPLFGTIFMGGLCFKMFQNVSELINFLGKTIVQVFCVNAANSYRYTHRNIFEILLNQPEIRLHLPFSDWFGSKRTSVWIQINRKLKHCCYI